MTPDAETVIARIRSGKRIGAGCLASTRTLLTCAHVISALLALPMDTQPPADAILEIDFPLVAPHQRAPAIVVSSDAHHDLAVLRMAQPVPKELVAPFVQPTRYWNRQFRAFGFPAGNPDGVWTSGVMRGPTAAGRVQLQCAAPEGFSLREGFSGAPVWDELFGGIAGIVVEFARERETRTGYMLPVAALIGAWSALPEEARVLFPDGPKPSSARGRQEELTAAHRVLEGLERLAQSYSVLTIPQELRTQIAEARLKIDELNRS